MSRSGLPLDREARRRPDWLGVGRCEARLGGHASVVEMVQRTAGAAVEDQPDRYRFGTLEPPLGGGNQSLVTAARIEIPADYELAAPSSAAQPPLKTPEAMKR